MAADGDLPWTTTRCNRLLRPISSKLAKLRKDLEGPRSIEGESHTASTAFATKGSPHKTTNFTQPVRKPRGFDKVRDPDWVPGTKLGGVNKKTYGGKGAKKFTGIQRVNSETGNVGRPGEITFTPLITRIGGRLDESPQLQGSPLRRYSKIRGPLVAKVEHIHNLKRRMPSDLEKLVKGTSEAYANLLQATAGGEEKRWRGTRSLMSTCLRKIPAYIEVEEFFAKQDKTEEDQDDDRAISNEIYTYLEEQFETLNGQGWRSLKQIVREHGTSLLCGALADGILGLETLHLLVSHCSNVTAWDEAEKLLWAYLPHVKPLPLPNNSRADLFDGQRSAYMEMTKYFIERTGRHRFLFDQLEYMLAQQLLPIEWLATECMRPIWDRVVRTLTDGDPRTLANALRFLETAIHVGIGLPDEGFVNDDEVDIFSRQLKPSSRQELRKALDTTFSSLLTILASVALVNRNREERQGEIAMQRVTWALDSIVVGLLKRKDIRSNLELLDHTPENAQAFSQRAIWLVFTSLLVHLEGCCLTSAMVSLDATTLVRTINWFAWQYSFNSVDISLVLASLPEFVSHVAHGTGRIWKDDGFDQLQRLVHTFLSLSGLRLPHKLWTLKRLALESAMEFAHSTSDKEHMAYARQIEKTMHQKGRVVIMHSPQKNDSPSTTGGFRWEEGIGEWVACTPFAKQNVKRLPQKPMRSLTLLPTPTPSEDDEDASSDTGANTVERSPEDHAHNSITWDTTVSDDDEEGAFPQSSPVNKAPRSFTTAVNKRIRASSPRVVIPTKLACLTPPDTPIIFYPELPRSPTAGGSHRTRRTRTQISDLGCGLHAHRTRSSLDKGLRNLERKTYKEVQDMDIDVDRKSKELESESESEPNTSSASLDESAIGALPASRCQSRTRSLLGKRPCRAAQDENFDGEGRDGLAKTPFCPRKKRLTVRNASHGRNGRWKVRRGVVPDDDESEDELSFH